MKPLPNFQISSSGPVSQAFLNLEIEDFQAAINHVQNLPYKRTSNKADYLLVLSEGQGTCSSKHALLVALAYENKVSDLELTVGIFKMNPNNTPLIANVFPANLPYLPEAHTYIAYQGERYDFTREGSNNDWEVDLLDEITIHPDEIVQKKTEFHQNYLRKWIHDNGIELTFDGVWKIREDCIDALGKE